MEHADFAGRVAIITGAWRGLGRAAVLLAIFIGLIIFIIFALDVTISALPASQSNET